VNEHGISMERCMQLKFEELYSDSVMFTCEGTQRS
jgi:hypothetical protein